MSNTKTILKILSYKLTIMFLIALNIFMTNSSSAEPKTLPSGLKIDDKLVGSGQEAVAGKTVSVNYTGWLWKDNAKGLRFDSSEGRGPFSFPLGSGRVIKGWDEGVTGMKVGGKRTLTIPAALAYGERGAGAAIPPNADLAFDVELLEVK